MSSITRQHMIINGKDEASNRNEYLGDRSPYLGTE